MRPVLESIQFVARLLASMPKVQQDASGLNGLNGSIPDSGERESDWSRLAIFWWLGMCNPSASYWMTMADLVEKELTGSIIGAFYEVYNTLGFGFLEHLYIKALERELLARGHLVERELRVRVMYKGEVLGTQRIDMVVDRRVVVEVKSTWKSVV